MDTFDYQRSSVPARMPAQRTTALNPQRFEGNSSENLPSPLSVQAVLRASRRYWWLILALWTLGSAGIGAAVYLRVKPLFRASSLLKVDPTMIDLYGGGAREGNEPYMQTHVTLITSPNVLTAAAQVESVQKWPRIKYAADAVQELTKAIMVSIRPGTHIIEVSMMSTIPDEAADMVNAVVHEFLDLNKTWSNGVAQKQYKKLTDYNDELRKKIDRTEKNMREHVKTRGVVGVLVPLKRSKRDDQGDRDDKDESPTVNDLTVESYMKMQARCSQINLDLIMAQAEMEDLQRIVAESAREAALTGGKSRSSGQIDARVFADPTIIQLNTKVKQAKANFIAIGDRTKHVGDPAELKAREQYRLFSAELKTAMENKRQQLQADPNSGSGDPVVELARAEKAVRDLQRQRASLEEELNKTKLQTTQQQSEEFEYQLLSQDHAAYKEMAQVIHKKLEQLAFDRNDDEERIRLINEARKEGTPIADKRMQYMAMAPIGVLGAVLGLVVLLELRSGRVADTDVLSSRMKHEVFAIAPLPNIRAGIGSDSDKAEQRLARFVQSLDHLRVALCEGGTPGEGRCVMITSATGGEGKTTLSAHLAARCANAGTSTLLIDADMRRASLGRLLDVPAGLGLGDVLAGEAELDGTLISAQAAGFHFLSAGTPGIDPTRVLKSTRLAELIGQLRQMYDLVIIDTPPVLPVADALIMGRWADGAVVAARYDASRLPLVERANRQIIAAGIPVLGVVVNGVKGQDQAYGNYAYSYSYPGRQEPLNDPGNAS